MFVKKIASAIVFASVFASVFSSNAFAGYCDTLYPTLPIAQPTGSKLLGSPNNYVINGSYGVGSSVDVKGSFYDNQTGYTFPGMSYQTFVIISINSVLYANNGSGFVAWNGNIDNLPAFSSGSSSASAKTLNIWSGGAGSGSYQVTYGFKVLVDLPKGNCFSGYNYYYNSTPISLTVQ